MAYETLVTEKLTALTSKYNYTVYTMGTLRVEVMPRTNAYYLYYYDSKYRNGEIACQTASLCKTEKGAIQKINKFLGL